MRTDTREDLPGAVCFERALGINANGKIWIHPSAVGAVEEDERENENSCVIVFRTGFRIYVKGDTQEAMNRLGWKECL